jgi:DNA/RNA-binding domain of Phe-tRNA-synthetase-like protein
MRGIDLSVAGELQGRLRVGLISASPVEVAPSSPGLLAEMGELCEKLKKQYTGRPPAQIEELRPAREFYKLFGMDPTKVRPSSEALLRRVLKGKPLPRISNAVDLCNFFALAFLLPIGLYDLEKVRGPVVLRTGRSGESFAGIRKDTVHLEGRPVLVDEDGPFGNPSSDSLRTCVEPATRALGMVIFAPLSVSREAMAGHVQAAREGMERHLVRGEGPDCCAVDVAG